MLLNESVFKSVFLAKKSTAFLKFHTPFATVGFLPATAVFLISDFSVDEDADDTVINLSQYFTEVDDRDSTTYSAVYNQKRLPITEERLLSGSQMFR